jgi:hypothetical protein
MENTMPYINPEKRQELDGIVDELSSKIESGGDLNYVITRLAHRRLQELGHRYGSMEQVVGTLECAKMELYRVVAAPYEDIKIEENGYVTETDEKHHVTLYKKQPKPDPFFTLPKMKPAEDQDMNFLGGNI